MKKLLLAVSASCALFSGAAHAADIGPVMETKDWFVNIGGTYVMPNSAGTLPIPRQNPSW